MNDSHIKNIIELTSPKSKKFVDSLAGKIKKQNGSRDWALKSLLSLTGNIDCLKNVCFLKIIARIRRKKK